VNSIAVSVEISSAIALANCGCALSPVPTAVPPMASYERWGSDASMWRRAWSSCDT
jgi:hypothetical protein